MVFPLQSQLFQVTGVPPWGQYALCIIVLVLTALVQTIFTKNPVLRHLDGRTIKELKGDARILKFAFSEELSKCGKELAGNDPYIINNGSSKELVITQPDHLKDFYRGDTKDHPKPVNLNMGAYFSRILGSAVGVQAGERWKIIRKYFDPEFSHASTLKAMPRSMNLVSQWAAQILKVEHKSTSCSANTINLLSAIKFLPFKVVAQQLYGEAFNEQLYAALLEINTLHEKILQDVLLNNRLTTKLWNLLPSEASRRMDIYVRKWEELNIAAIKRVREDNLDSPLERIYRGVDQFNEMHKLEFLHTVDEILFTNVDISSAVLKTLFTRLAADQAFQTSLRTEIASEENQQDFYFPNYAAKTDSLLNFIVMESIRHTPAFWFSLPECTAVAKTIGGFQVPANTAIVIDSGRLNKDAITWGADGHDFRPERFREIPQSRCRYGYMKFGVGGASGRCLGKHVADNTFKLAVFSIVKRFVLKLPKDNASGSAPVAVEFHPL